MNSKGNEDGNENGGGSVLKESKQQSPPYNSQASTVKKMKGVEEAKQTKQTPAQKSDTHKNTIVHH